VRCDCARPCGSGITCPIARWASSGCAAASQLRFRSGGEEVWGALIVACTEPGGLSADGESRLQEFGDLLAAAIRSIEDREKLAAQASSDPLTGLANHRTLQLSLASEVARAVRHESPLSVAVLDIDHFKPINDAAATRSATRC
jgi:predicted signal transduction protein with EAL and GGDEF domain